VQNSYAVFIKKTVFHCDRKLGTSQNLIVVQRHAILCKTM